MCVCVCVCVCKDWWFRRNQTRTVIIVASIRSHLISIPLPVPYHRHPNTRGATEHGSSLFGQREAGKGAWRVENKACWTPTKDRAIWRPRSTDFRQRSTARRRVISDGWSPASSVVITQKRVLICRKSHVGATVRRDTMWCDSSIQASARWSVFIRQKIIICRCSSIDAGLQTIEVRRWRIGPTGRTVGRAGGWQTDRPTDRPGDLVRTRASHHPGEPRGDAGAYIALQVLFRESTGAWHYSWSRP